MYLLFSFGPYFVEPVIAGLDADDQPFVCATDLIGAPVYTSDFVVFYYFILIIPTWMFYFCGRHMY